MQIIQILNDMASNIVRDCEDKHLTKEAVLDRLMHLCYVLDVSPYDYIE
ncbi:hypothetical protein KAX02_13820 [candidate division WOR-3 bacterium]|nr:hypothetical protein [candidate division WOR-3 bacterium]